MFPPHCVPSFQNGGGAGEENVLSRERRRRRKRRRRREEESPRKQRRGGGASRPQSSPRCSVGLQQSEDALEAAADATPPPAATEQRGLVVLVEAPSDAEAFVPPGKRKRERRTKMGYITSLLNRVTQLNLTRQRNKRSNCLFQRVTLCIILEASENIWPLLRPSRKCECDQILLMNLTRGDPGSNVGTDIFTPVGLQGTVLCTGPVDRMSHKKWRETKQQPSRARTGHQISCCLLLLHFLCDILSTGTL